MMDDTVKKLYDTIGVTDYTLPTITEKDTRQRYTATVTVIRDGKEVELNDVQFFTYYKTKRIKRQISRRFLLTFMLSQSTRHSLL